MKAAAHFILIQVISFYGCAGFSAASPISMGPAPQVPVSKVCSDRTILRLQALMEFADCENYVNHEADPTKSVGACSPVVATVARERKAAAASVAAASRRSLVWAASYTDQWLADRLFKMSPRRITELARVPQVKARLVVEMAAESAGTTADKVKQELLFQSNVQQLQVDQLREGIRRTERQMTRTATPERLNGALDLQKARLRTAMAEQSELRSLAYGTFQQFDKNGKVVSTLANGVLEREIRNETVDTSGELGQLVARVLAKTKLKPVNPVSPASSLKNLSAFAMTDGGKLLPAAIRGALLRAVGEGVIGAALFTLVEQNHGVRALCSAQDAISTLQKSGDALSFPVNRTPMFSVLGQSITCGQIDAVYDAVGLSAPPAEPVCSMERNGWIRATVVIQKTKVNLCAGQNEATPRLGTPETHRVDYIFDRSGRPITTELYENKKGSWSKVDVPPTLSGDIVSNPFAQALPYEDSANRFCQEKLGFRHPSRSRIQPSAGSVR
jgi:hypothetical protein